MVPGDALSLFDLPPAPTFAERMRAAKEQRRELNRLHDLAQKRAALPGLRADVEAAYARYSERHEQITGREKHGRYAGDREWDQLHKLGNRARSLRAALNHLERELDSEGGR